MLLLPTLFRERKAVEVRWDHKNGITRAKSAPNFSIFTNVFSHSSHFAFYLQPITLQFKTSNDWSS
jgi:hypothetical protein